MSNPEFKRNLWQSFSTHRLIAMPVLLALTFLATTLADQQSKVADRLYAASVALFIFIVWLWGARNANASIVDELRDKTWDQQRMSALDPWTMTWGKLFGSTSFNWYGGLMCLVVIAISGIASDKPDVISTLCTLCAVGVLLHAALIALNLHTSQLDTRLIQRGGIGWLVIILLFTFIAAVLEGNLNTVSWWGRKMDHASFWLESALLFAACATFAAWRVTCNALQVRTLPWAWPLFACLLALYLGGFIYQGAATQTFLLTGLPVSVTMTYVSLFSEPNTLIKWRKLQLLLINKDIRGWLEHLPLWPSTLVLSFLFTLLIQLSPSETHRVNYVLLQNAPAVALMLLRDACILMFFALPANNKRALSATLLYLFMLDLLLPFLAGIANLDAVRFFFLPFGTGHAPWSATVIMALHVAVATGLVNWRLHKEEAILLTTSR